MTDINTKVELMAQDINYIKTELAEIKMLVKDVAENKANKWVEKAIVGVVVFALTAMGTAFFALILD